MKTNLYHLTFLIVLILSLAARISILNYPSNYTYRWGDGTRDYLVAHHILKYNELPATGPYNLLAISGVQSSPFYYYLLSLFLWPFDSLFSLGVVNLLLQVVMVICIYLLSRRLFHPSSALLASIFFSFLPEVLRQSEYIWQPFVMQLFAYNSLLFLAFAHFKNSYRLLVVSVILATIAFSLHHSVFSWLPTLFALTIVVLKKINKAGFVINLFGLCLIIVATFTLLYLPAIIYSLGTVSSSGLRWQQIGPNLQESGLYLASYANYLTNLSYNLVQLLSSYSLHPGSLTVKLLLLGLLFCFLAYLLSAGISLKKKVYLLLGILLASQPLFFSSLFNKNQLHYLTVSLGLFSIAVAEITNPFNHKSLLIKVIKSITALLLLYTAILSSYAVKVQDIYPKHSIPYDEASFIIKDEIQQIQLRENLPDANFFQISSYANYQTSFRYQILDTILLVPLEYQLNRKLVAVDDSSPYNHYQINSSKYIFLVCFEFVHNLIVGNCTTDFFLQHPNYQFINHVFTNYPISVYKLRAND